MCPGENDVVEWNFFVNSGYFGGGGLRGGGVVNTSKNDRAMSAPLAGRQRELLRRRQRSARGARGARTTRLPDQLHVLLARIFAALDVRRDARDRDDRTEAKNRPGTVLEERPHIAGAAGDLFRPLLDNVLDIGPDCRRKFRRSRHVDRKALLHRLSTQVVELLFPVLIHVPVRLPALGKRNVVTGDGAIAKLIALELRPFLDERRRVGLPPRDLLRIKALQVKLSSTRRKLL